MPPSVIIISGPAGSGKSTLAEHLAKALNYKCVHASDIFRQIQENKKKLDAFATKQGQGYWESDAALKYYDTRLGDLSLDKQVDEELLAAIAKGKVVMDSWATPWLSKTGFKIWLDVSEKARLQRLVGRDGMPTEKLRLRVKTKEEKTSAIYKQLYGFDFGKDFSPFHARLDTNGLDEFQVLEKALELVKAAKEK
ncbi:MAG: cytidylate kinase family protein [Candidatus Micrarchaeota archaeon]